MDLSAKQESFAAALLALPKAPAAARPAAVKILFTSDAAVSPDVLAPLVADVRDARCAAIGGGRNSFCYRMRFSGGRHMPKGVVLKEACESGNRTNPDTTFEREARLLIRMRREGIPGAPELVVRFVCSGRYYLLTEFIDGFHPASSNPFDGPHLEELADTLFLMDMAGILHCDLQASNILLAEDAVRLIDFEFGREANVLDAYHPSRDSFCDDYNISNNPYFFLRSNMSNFEFRALYRHLELTRRDVSLKSAVSVLARYLQAKSRYHENMAHHLGVLGTRSLDDITRRSGQCREDVAWCLAEASAYEGVLALLYSRPDREVLAVEFMIMRYKYLLFHRDYNGAAEDIERLHAACMTMLRRFLCRATSGGNDCMRHYLHQSVCILEALYRKHILGRQ